MDDGKKKKDQFEFERDKWIKQFGSEYLKKAKTLGYNVDFSYLNERVTREIPDFEVDYDDSRSWILKKDPSICALNEVEKLIKHGYDSKVISLIVSIDCDECENCEM